MVYVDGDIILFKAVVGIGDSTDFGDQVLESFSTEEIEQSIDRALDYLKMDLKGEEFTLCFTGRENFRKTLFETYKSNRKETKKPLGYTHGLAYLHKLYPDSITVRNLEADDLLGIKAMDKGASLWSRDKDLRTIPVRQFDFELGGFRKQSLLEADTFLYWQVLTGDACDGYKGCPKIGKKKATKFLDDCEDELELFKATHHAYLWSYRNYEDAKKNLLEQIGQARILRSYDEFHDVCRGITYNPYEKFDIDEELKEMEVPKIKAYKGLYYGNK